MRKPFRDILGDDTEYNSDIEEELAYLHQMENSELGEKIQAAEQQFAETADPVALTMVGLLGYNESQMD